MVVLLENAPALPSPRTMTSSSACAFPAKKSRRTAARDGALTARILHGTAGASALSSKNMSVAYVLIAILGLAVLMIVHEGGHYLAARRFGMRVTRFSIGFGPTLWKHRPKGSPTTFQIAIIPFLAYVQIAGMNPYEDSDPKDPESYANASLWARIVTIAAGPIANYLFASVLMFFGFLLGGNPVVDEASMRVHVGANGPAAQAGIVDGDRILTVNGDAVKDWDMLKKQIGAHPGDKI